MKRNAGIYLRKFRKAVLFIVAASVLFSFFSCSSTKKLHKGDYLLANNRIMYRFGSSQKAKGLGNITTLGKEGIEKFEIPQRIAPSEVLPYVKQKPNTRILFVLPLYLYLYNLPDSAKTANRKALKDLAYTIKAQKKHWTQEKLKRKIDKKTGREWIMSQGEAPVIIDTSLTQRSTEQIKTFLFNKGYFNAQVKDSIHTKGKRADAAYIIRCGTPYKIGKVDYLFEDLGLASEILSDTSECKIRSADIYDKDVLDAESDRITLQLDNAGYYYFSRQYVSYILDTNTKTHIVNITVNIKKFVERDAKNKDSTIEVNHTWYRIRHVTVQMNYDPASAIYHADDTLAYEGITIVYSGDQLCLKPNILRPKIFINPGDVYRVGNKEDTYTGLSQLNEFSYVSVKYLPIKDSNYVDCYIQLMPVVKHSVGAELEGTNTSGYLGAQGDISYENYNQFKGAEKLQFKINGGFIAQPVLAGSSGTSLNTLDIGPELDFTVPRPLAPVSLFHFSRKVNPQSTIKLSFDYQQHYQYYTRHILGLSYAFDYNPVKNQHFTFALFEMSFVNASFTPYFAGLLQNYNLFFQNSFTNQVITDGRVSWTLTTQDPARRKKRFSYWKINGEFSGLVFDALEHWHLLNLPVNNLGEYYIKQLGAPFSQYLKLDGEFRQYWPIGKKQKVVGRILAGYGYAYYNSTNMPFTKSFWAGGPNDIREWQIQELGPGGSPPSPVAGQVGDTKLEANLEYRVSLIKYFGMAGFIDAGNIWLLKNSATDNIPLAFMNVGGPNPFWSEIAVGLGIGFRFDFNYFVIRLDIGTPLKDPSLAPGSRWLDFDQSIGRKIYNIGIGYPF